MAGSDDQVYVDMTPMMESLREQMMNMNQQQALNFMKLFKEQGNKCFNSKDYASACEQYAAGIHVSQAKIMMVSSAEEWLRKEAVLLTCQLLTNKSVCLYELGRFQDSMDDAWFATNLNSKWWKGYYRGALANGKLGNSHEAMMAICHGLKSCHPGPEFKPRCTMILTALKFGIVSIQNGDLKKKTKWDRLWSFIIAEINTTSEWKTIMTHLAQEGEWAVITRIVLVDKPQQMGKYAESMVLSDLVELAMKGESWCDEVIQPLISAGADEVTLMEPENGEPLVFAALHLGLASGRFIYLQNLIERSPDAKDMVNQQGETMIAVAEKSDASTGVKATAIALLSEGVGVKPEWETTYESAKSRITQDLIQDLATYKDNEELDQAVAVLKELLSRTDVDKKQLYIERCQIYMKQKNHEGAMDDANNLLEYDKDCLDAHRIRCSIYEEKSMMSEYFHEQTEVYRLSTDNGEKDGILFRLVCFLKRATFEGDLLLQVCNPDLGSWSRLIHHLYSDKQMRALLRILTMDHDKQGELARYRTGSDIVLFSSLIPKVSKIKNDKPKWNVIQSVLILLLERGADVRTFFSDRHVRLVKKPVSAIFIVAIHIGPTLLDYLIDRGDLDREPDYPRSTSAIHQYLKSYRQLPSHMRSVMLCRLQKELNISELWKKRLTTWKQYVNQLTNPDSRKCKFLLEEAKRLQKFIDR